MRAPGRRSKTQLWWATTCWFHDTGSRMDTEAAIGRRRLIMYASLEGANQAAREVFVHMQVRQKVGAS